MFDPTKAIEIVQRIAPKTLFAFGLATGIILFAPVELIEKLQLETFRDKYGFWTGLVCLTTSSLLAMHFAWWITAKFKSTLNERRRRKVRQEFLRDLTPDERGFLAPYVVDEVTTRYVDVSDGVVNGLEARGIVYRSASMFELDRKPFNIQPWARDYLRANPELLMDPAEYPRQRRRW